MNHFHKISLCAITVCVCCILSSAPSRAEINSGFINGLWYSQNPFFADQTVRIYTAIYNNNPFDIRGVVEFQDGDQIIGLSNFTALSGRTEEAWLDWKATFGAHRLSANLTKMEKLEIGKEPVPMTGTNPAMSDQPFVDLDSDHDGIGNKIDPDDDNDGVTDEEEIKNGTDPLVANNTLAPPSQNNADVLSQISNIVGDWKISTSSDKNTAKVEEKIALLNNGLNFLKQIGAKEKVLTDKLRTILEQQNAPSDITASTTGGLVLQDISEDYGIWSKIYRIILSTLIVILKIPPLLLTIGFIIIFLLILRSWIRFRRWRQGRY